MIRVLFVVLAVLLVVPGWSGETRLPLMRADARVFAQRVALDTADPARRAVGTLRFLGGAVLTSDDPAFGGFSSLTVFGDRFTLLSDGGNYVRFRMGADWTPRTEASGYLPGGPATGWEKRDRDSEAMTSDGRHVWVGFEGANAIWRYDARFRRVEAHAAPCAMADWPDNGGPESLVRMADGRFVAISEQRHLAKRFWHGSDATRLRTREALIYPVDPTTGSPQPRRFALIVPRHYDPSDAAALPDGGLVVLERRFRLPYAFVSRIVRLAPSDVAAGGITGGEMLATLDAPLLHDNFEGIAVVREGDATMLWIVSDDNESLLQRTLLLKFELMG